MIIRYIGRRLLQMIPTIFGVLLITFILFNLVGGSPGRMMLGDKAAARDLEMFDDQRGFNRPLFWGHYRPSRIYSATDFKDSAGPWTALSGVEHSVDPSNPAIRITGPVEISLPLAFDYLPGNIYEWRITYRIHPQNNPATLITSDGTLHPMDQYDFTTITWQDQATQPGADTRPRMNVPVDTILEISSVHCARVNERPWESQWSHYMGQLLRFDFGRSHAANQKVSEMLKQGIGPTLMLAAPILMGETMIGVTLALGCAFWRNRMFDRIILIASVACMSINYLVWIVAGQYWLGYRFNLFPVWGFESYRYLLLPVLVGIVHGLGPNVRFYRTVMLEEMHRDYVRTARAKGVGTRGILFRHVLKNAMIPVITSVVLSLPFLYTGSLLLETFFGIPGLGYISINAINSSDVDVVRAVVLIGSFLYLAANLLADLCYAWADPRVKLT